mgnify:CR=1 FL=1
MKKIDYLIVGQGIAGSTLAHSLLQEGKSVMVVDEDKDSTSSKIAAGLCNPVVFKRLTKSWMIDKVLEYAKEYYRHQEQLLGDQYYFDLPIYKLFANEKEQKFWLQKCNDPEMIDWLSSEIEYPFDSNLIQYPFGAAHVQNSGYLNTENWLAGFKNYLIEKQYYLASKFNYNEVNIEEDSISWNTYRANKVIFCEGYNTINNPYFNWLPFKLTKGEVLTVNFENLNMQAAINKGVFVLPHDGNYKLGATYDWDKLDEEITEEARINLLNRTEKFLSDEIVVVSQKAGIRPTVIDRRPLIGVHPDNSNLLVFNGLGTKGVMLAPYFANRLVEFLLHNEPLPDEVNISRFLGKDI